MVITRDKLNELYAQFYNLNHDKLHLVTNQDNVACSKSKPTVLFLDEISRAPVDVRQAALQLVLDKRLHSHHLPYVNGRKTLIVAADNPADGDYQVDTLDPALLDRFLELHVEVDVKSWLEWARQNKVNQVVRDFITENPTKIHFMPEDGSTGATPRSWTKLGQFIDGIDKIPHELHFNIIKGKIGSELGAQFLSFLKNYVDVVKVKDIQKLVNGLKSKNLKIEQLGDAVAELLEKQEAIQKSELTNQIVHEFFEDETKDSLPMMAMLYSLEIELLNGFLKGYRGSNSENYLKLSELDFKLNNKNLFKKITQKTNV